MTVGEMIAELQKFPADFKIVLNEDGEGRDWTPGQFDCNEAARKVYVGD